MCIYTVEYHFTCLIKCRARVLAKMRRVRFYLRRRRMTLVVLLDGYLNYCVPLVNTIMTSLIISPYYNYAPMSMSICGASVWIVFLTCFHIAIEN